MFRRILFCAMYSLYNSTVRSIMRIKMENETVGFLNIRITSAI
jgi:hypothetical protein